jgi:nitroreductase
MDFLTLAERRYSVRAYKPDPIPDEVLKRVLTAANLAPTACNRQPFRILVLPTRGRETELLRIYHQGWFVQGPLVIGMVGVVAESWSRRDGVNYTFVDVTIAMDHLILAATEQGLGTCWIAAFNPSAAREILGLPKGVEPVAFTPLGYAADAAGPKTRRPLDQTVRWNHW